MIAIENVDTAVSRIFPFLDNFPFENFNITESRYVMASESYTIIDLEDEDPLESDVPEVISDIGEMKLISFSCDHFMGNTNISITENDVNFIKFAASEVSTLNAMSKIVSEAISSQEMKVKRDAVLEVFKWTTEFAGDRLDLRPSTSLGVFDSLVKEFKVDNHTEILRKMEDLFDKKGIHLFDDAEHSTIMHFMQFLLVYGQIILGIVIASKLES